MSRLRTWADSVFGVDLRSLGLFRILLALVLLWDLFDRSKSVAAHYTETGTIPAHLLPLITNGAQFSLHYWLSGSLEAQWALLLVNMAAGVALLLGWHTRVAALVAWFLLSSLQVRNPLISWEGADKLLRILLLWSALAPIGARFSLDARRAGNASREAANWLCTPATALFVLQVFALYHITGLAKTGANWANGMALEYALRVDFFGGPLGRPALAYPRLLELASHLTVVMERFGPFLLLVPVYTWLGRLVVMGGFYGFHLGVLVLMGVGYFSPISMSMWIAILPSQVWDAADALRGRAADATRAAAARLPTPRPIELAAALLCGFMVLSIAAKNVGFFLGEGIGLGPVDRVARLLRVSQEWPMFSPQPPQFDLWPVMRGYLRSGVQVDAFRGGPVTATQPASVAAYFPSFKWKIHFWWLGHTSWQDEVPHVLWEPLAEHLCYAWNARHEGREHMDRVDIVLRIEAIAPDRPEDPVKDWPVVRGHPCRQP